MAENARASQLPLEVLESGSGLDASQVALEVLEGDLALQPDTVAQVGLEALESGNGLQVSQVGIETIINLGNPVECSMLDLAPAPLALVVPLPQTLHESFAFWAKGADDNPVWPFSKDASWIASVSHWTGI